MDLILRPASRGGLYTIDEPIEMNILDGLKIAFAGSSRLRRERLRLVTRYYLHDGYITAEDIDDRGLYHDSFEDRAFPYVVKTANGEIVASMRLIFGTVSRLPVNKLNLNDEIIQRTSRYKCCEISQLVVREDYRRSRANKIPHLMAALVQFSIMVAAAHNARRVFAVVNETLYRHISRTMTQWPSELAGPPQQLAHAPYHDSELLYLLSAPTNALIKKILGQEVRHD